VYHMRSREIALYRCIGLYRGCQLVSRPSRGVCASQDPPHAAESRTSGPAAKRDRHTECLPGPGVSHAFPLRRKSVRVACLWRRISARGTVAAQGRTLVLDGAGGLEPLAVLTRVEVEAMLEVGHTGDRLAHLLVARVLSPKALHLLVGEDERVA
jgi:hypothetical protein